MSFVVISVTPFGCELPLIFAKKPPFVLLFILYIAIMVILIKFFSLGRIIP